MNLFIGLTPVTALGPRDLGSRLANIVGARENQGLCIDFPRLRVAYRNVREATETVWRRQEDMRAKPEYAAFAIRLGTSPQTMRVYGMLSAHVQPLPRNRDSAGPMVAFWLDARRPPALRRVGIRLMSELQRELLARSAFVGTIWSVVRPRNGPSVRIWQYADYAISFQPVGKPDRYDQIDGVMTPRQLFVACRTLQAVRLH